MTSERHHQNATSDVAILTEELETLRRLLSEAECANEAKAMFFATMSHEIREPMNGVLGMTRLLQETPLSDEQKGYVDAVHFSGQALLTIINDILDLSRMEAGKLRLDRIDFDLINVVERTIDLLRPRAEGKGLALELDIASDVPKALSGDPGRLRQLLMNLLGNAVKFTEKGKVRLAVRPLADEGGRLTLGLDIEDTGIGIPDHLKDRLFTPYAQADPSVPRLYGGSGLGLTICKRLVKLMEGGISVESALGSGTHFRLELPFEKAAPEHAALPPSGQIAGLHILVVDPNEVTRMMLDQQALSWGAVTHLVDDGQTALAALDRARGASSPIDVVLIDSVLPDMSGESLGRSIRQREDLADAALVMMASSGIRGDAARVAEIGFAGYLPKPVTPTDLLNCLLKLRDSASRARGELITVHSLSENLPDSLDILLADDNPVNTKIASTMLEKAGHRIDTVADGAAAIDAILGKTYDLVLMDVQMPVMDGLAATRRIRAMPRHGSAHLPIVAVTANAMTGDDRQCLDAGMDDYVTKPIDRARLLSKVNQWGYRGMAAQQAS
ncbi:MAG: response regulator [Geminicoccaceae bacterium]